MQQRIKKHLPYAYSLFLMVAEPRAIRIMQFGIYICMGVTGVGIVASPPDRYQDVISLTLVTIFGWFLVVGSLLGAIAVLPGIWWLERVGLISLITGMSMYCVILISLNASFVGFTVALLFGLTFGQRWLEIRRFQLAPKEPIKDPQELKEV